ncbi:hypothetical protein Hamer_G005836 [Homarus americanus]|uniref:Methyltransferase FkbM domain-containing protein n=1 Tax=Homarus americanus TaxID=6706 RepID=A0A8J5JFU6_HOMAM|nr:hypothetical protein Hamer_G005836 [Homarus americanus]
MIKSVMRTWNKLEQMVTCFVRKYLMFAVLGMISSCAFVNMALHAGAGLHYYCQEECLKKALTGPLLPLDKDIILHIRKYWIDPPAPRGSYKSDFPLENPPWASMGNWVDSPSLHLPNTRDPRNLRREILPHTANFKRGTFVEIGASDGEFKSVSLYAEQKLGFKGLLIEPNPGEYQELRAKKRSAYTVNACASIYPGHVKNDLWIRNTPVNLPYLLYRLQKSSNRLVKYVSQEDSGLGRTTPVQCFNVGALTIAALKTTTIDLLAISTHGGELEILDAIPKAIKINLLVLVTPIATQDDMDLVKALTEARDLKPIFLKYNMNIFITADRVAKA